MSVTLPRPHQNYLLYVMPQRNQVQKVSNETQIQSAIQALKQDANLTQRRAAARFNVPQSTLSDRIRKKVSRDDWKPKSIKLLLTEEETIVQYILNLAVRGFPP